MQGPGWALAEPRGWEGTLTPPRPGMARVCEKENRRGLPPGSVVPEAPRKRFDHLAPKSGCLLLRECHPAAAPSLLFGDTQHKSTCERTRRK